MKESVDTNGFLGAMHKLDNDEYKQLEGYCNELQRLNHCAVSEATSICSSTESTGFHVCDLGVTNNCDSKLGRCLAHPSGYSDIYQCSCLTGYKCSSGCDFPYRGHKCEFSPAGEVSTPAKSTASDSSDSATVAIIAAVAAVAVVIAIVAFVLYRQKKPASLNRNPMADESTTNVAFQNPAYEKSDSESTLGRKDFDDGLYDDVDGVENGYDSLSRTSEAASDGYLEVDGEDGVYDDVNDDKPTLRRNENPDDHLDYGEEDGIDDDDYMCK